MTFSKAQSSKLERLFSLKSGKRDVRVLSFELSKMSLQVRLAAYICIHMYLYIHIQCACKFQDFIYIIYIHINMQCVCACDCVNVCVKRLSA